MDRDQRGVCSSRIISQIAMNLQDAMLATSHPQIEMQLWLK